MPRTARSAVRPGHALRAVLAALALVSAGLAGVVVASSSTALVTAAGTSADVGRTWVVDAVDPLPNDGTLNRWESADTGTFVVTIAVGDTVEWQFDRATQGHDLTSQPPASTTETSWSQPLAEYRDPGGQPVRRTFTEPGTYRYICSMHGSSMSGLVIVVPAGDNASPTAAPVVSPTSGEAPLVVHATANAADPDGDVPTVSWDFGAGGPVAHTDHAMFEYRTPGQYVARLRVSDGRGGLRVEEFPITVTGEGGPTDPEPPPGDGALPTIDALAAPARGAAPLAVAFSTQVTTRGALHAYSVGLEAYPALTGEAVMVRSRGRTHTSLQVSGTKPGARHAAVHVHERACADELGGAHFRFDTDQPFAEPNEIWPLFTSDAAGASGLVEVTKPLRAGPSAVSLVVHDPDNAARRIGCADLAPGTADLTYSWSFGDGTTGTGADPDHTYAAPGTYTATVTVGHGSGAHSGHGSVSDSVQVVVAGDVPPTVTPPVPPVATPPVPPVPPVGVTPPVVDAAGPRITRPTPRGTVRSARPTVRVRVLDRESQLRRRDLVLRLDGRPVAGLAYDAARHVVRWRPARALAPGRHVLRLVALDRAGNRSTATWRFVVRLR
ncbi:PKD domain-containing protein [Nocardioides sp. zg-1308]|uniref:PKD domain-containing protein n=1 Tax=Nocardioides sp. zg-1308 TaxID=2736253 RepID=UPI001552CE2B|nr:PKD domain-containing protein [Nocardioides sp. zg-1308]NPD03854.1 PKD domain-containing protein [Nocardioides sp. zg-1308]